MDNGMLEERAPVNRFEVATVSAIDMPFPRLWYSAGRLKLLKDAYLSQDPLFTPALNEFLGIAARARGPMPGPYSGDKTEDWRISMVADGKNCVCLALAYHLTGKQHHLERAVDRIRAHCEAMPDPLAVLDPEHRFPNLGLDTICGSSGLILAYDMLAGDTSFPEESRSPIESWFRTLVGVIHAAIARWEDNNYFGGQDFQNHIGEHMMGLAQIGMVLGDRELVQFALDSDDNPRDLKAMINGAIHIKGDKPDHHCPPQTGEIFDRYRTCEGKGFGYAFHGYRMIVLTAELAWRLGLDFYQYEGPDGERLDLPLLFYRDFVLTGDSTLKGGYYHKSELPPGKFNDYYELGILRYPEHRDLFLPVLDDQNYNRSQPSFDPVHKPTLSLLLAFGKHL
jgi:hypothetical protein